MEKLDSASVILVQNMKETVILTMNVSMAFGVALKIVQIILVITLKWIVVMFQLSYLVQIIQDHTKLSMIILG